MDSWVGRKWAIGSGGYVCLVMFGVAILFLEFVFYSCS